MPYLTCLRRKPPSAFDEFGDYNKRVVVQSHGILYSWDISQHIIDACVMVTPIKLIHLTSPIPLHLILRTLLGYFSYLVWVSCSWHQQGCPWNFSHFCPCLDGILMMLSSRLLKWQLSMLSFLWASSSKSGTNLLLSLSMSTGWMSWLLQIPYIWILQLLTLVPPLPKFLLVWSP